MGDPSNTATDVAECASAAPRAITPRATYRLQLRPEFGFGDAAALADYLAELGISHVYLSPFLQAMPGSTHGYDIIDHGRVNADLGGEAGHAAMCRAFEARGLSQVLDVVPNHMCIASRHNQWWWDVLEHGPTSRYAAYFDVDWRSADQRLTRKVLLPILGDHYGRVLAAGHVVVGRADGGFVVKVYDQVLPIAPAALAEPLSQAAALAGSEELAFYANALDLLPASEEAVEQRERTTRVIRRALERLLADDARIAAIVDRVLEELSADAERLHALLERQHYRIAFWRVASHELDYRRFFDIASLVGLRTERPDVFAMVHRLPLGWIADGVAEGLRIDHPDGLRDPAAYFTRLRQAAPNAWIVAEKILERDEPLPVWPIDGTTGYDALRLLDGVFVEPSALGELDAIYQEVVGEPVPDFSTLVTDCKRRVLLDMLATDLDRLANVFVAWCESGPRYRDFSRVELRNVLKEVIVALPGYRTYVAPGSVPSARDIRAFDEALAGARAARADLDDELFVLLRKMFLDPDRDPLQNELLARLQQLSAPAMAKGMEDTALYNHQRLVCLNEVGGDPRRFGCSVRELHEYFARMQARFPVSMVATSTHDTKRSADVRLRLAMLTHDPDAWRAFAREAMPALARHGRVDAPTRYLFLQSVVGAWPIDASRLGAYLLKAAREAKAHTSWLRPEPDYETALDELAHAALEDREWVALVDRFVEPLAELGRRASLSQLLLALTVPGVPDIYQGCELWRLALTDPDSRRPVDFERRRQLLSRCRDLGPEEALAGMSEGVPKLWLLARALRVKRRLGEVFGRNATYEPLAADDHVVAFCRSNAVVTAVPTRFDRDASISLPSGRWRCVLSGEQHSGTVSAARLWSRFPVALLTRQSARIRRS
ncbi:MAG TPA: malto-oligosyltrehalose synthase [Polyangiaceae bacterium]|nr:malto-oligosyltrehalose synthase [Polyangiaceae bacterium]